ncbi:hypothetical protein NC652_040318 [Populus alba x Populus x berolinensis]|nr:hypothetical protein NC652_040318 [Populus alba x Populus x berolinensis]
MTSIQSVAAMPEVLALSADPDDFDAGPGSAVIRSINVVPDEES